MSKPSYGSEKFTQMDNLLDQMIKAKIDIHELLMMAYMLGHCEFMVEGAYKVCGEVTEEELASTEYLIDNISDIGLDMSIIEEQVADVRKEMIEFMKVNIDDFKLFVKHTMNI